MPTEASLKFRIRITKGETIAVGPGKIALLEAIIDTGSITSAAKKLGMSYRRAWLLVDAMNQSFRRAVVDTARGGACGGGTEVTELGREVIRLYRAVEARSAKAAASDISALLRLLHP